MSSSVLEINRAALENNIRFIRQMIGDDVIISVVVKGNAYGHGLGTVIPVFEEAGINHFSVFSSGGAKRAFRVKNENTHIMIMGYVDPDHLEWVIRHHISFFVFDIQVLRQAILTARKLDIPACIHLEIETGLHRTGLDKKDLELAADVINDNAGYLEITGVATHLAGAESIANHVRIMQQFKLYEKRLKWLNKKGIVPKWRHTASSAAAVSYPRSRMDLVRIGIMSYGFWPTRETFLQYIHNQEDKTDPLQRAISWKSTIMSVKNVAEGEFVGYGFGFQAQQDMQIAVVPVGYSNGYSRMLSNNGHILVKGQRADVIGSVNMNMILINTTHIENVETGDEVVLLGSQGDYEISVASFADMNNSMNYELLARLPERIERKII
ncbi:MAG TPA: alanine racemase [Bacteroidales bacterium]|nr:alanine racemase [Bacteroidales bacterium]